METKYTNKDLQKLANEVLIKKWSVTDVMLRAKDMTPLQNEVFATALLQETKTIRLGVKNEQ